MPASLAEGVPKVGERARIRWLERDGALEGGDGGITLAKLVEHDAEVVVGVDWFGSTASTSRKLATASLYWCSARWVFPRL